MKDKEKDLFGYYSEERNIVEYFFRIFYWSLLSKDCCTRILLILVEYYHGHADKRIVLLCIYCFRTRKIKVKILYLISFE